MTTIEKILILYGMEVGSVKGYANQLVKELDTRVSKWCVITPFYTSVDLGGMLSAEVSFICSKRQAQESEKQAYLEQDFSSEIKALEKMLKKLFQISNLKMYEFVPNFSKVDEVERISRSNFGNVQVTSMIMRYEIKTSVRQLECAEIELSKTN